MSLRTIIHVIFLCIGLPIFSQSSIDFTANLTEGCKPLVVNLQPQAPGAVTYEWDTGQGISTLSNPNILYSDEGYFDVTLTVTYADGTQQSLTKNQFVSVYDYPLSQFSADTLSICSFQPVSFTDLSAPGSGSIDEWLWDFGDGNGSNEQHPTHTYETPGLYPVSLVVTNNHGCTDQHVADNYIEVQAPDADFTGDTLLACGPPLTTTFTPSSTSGTHYWNLGDGTISTSNLLSHTYQEIGNFDIGHAVVDADGCRDTVIRSSYVNIGISTISIEASDTVICAQSEVAFTANISGASTVYWDFGTGDTSILSNPTYTFNTAGNYQVAASVTDPSGCSNTLLLTISVNEVPILSFTTSDTILGCKIPFEVDFLNQSTGAISYQWDLGDGTQTSSQAPTHFYTAEDSFDVKLIGTSAEGCVASLIKENYIVLDEIEADFDIDDSGGCVSHEAQFHDTTRSPYPVNFWIWDFGDGNTSNSQDPSHIFLDTGYYDITLVVGNTHGCKDTLTISDAVSVGELPEVDFAIDTNQACAFTPVQFFNLSSGAQSFIWIFGDGDTAMSVQPSHGFGALGLLSTTLIGDDRGCRDTVFKSEVIEVLAPLPTIGTSDKSLCKVPEEVVFTDLSIGADQTLWVLDTLLTTSDLSFTYTFLENGTYPFTLTVSNLQTGCTVQAEDSIVVRESRAYFQVSDSVGCLPFEVAFFDQSVDAGLWRWYLEGDNTGFIQAPQASFTYTEAGSYYPKLITRSSLACWDTFTMGPIVVHEIAADLSIDDPLGCIPYDAQFMDQSITTNAIVQWEWAFGDSTTSTLQNPVHVYQSSGFYDVKLIVTDSIGCTDSISVPDIVYATQPIPDFLISPEINCTDKSAVFLNLSTGSGLSYFWDFGDGDDSNLANVNHAYQDTGAYDVTLTVTDINGCDSTLHIPEAVLIREVMAQFTVDTTYASCPPLTVNFEADTTLPHDGLTYTWDFGNGASSSQPISNITYSLPGVYDVRLIVSSETGCSDTLVIEDLIVVEGTSAQFGFTPQQGCPGTEVSFTAQSDLAVNYEWLLGDGSAALGTTVQHTYHTSGSYTPVLVVEDTTGCKVFQISDSTIDIFEAPTAYFSIMDTLGCDSLAVQLIQQSTGGVPLTQWNWYVDGVLADSGSNPGIHLDQLGVYDLSLIVSDVRGCRDTLERLSAVKVASSPTPQITTGDSVGCIPFSTQAVVLVPGHPSPLLESQWTLDSNQTGQGSPHTIDVAMPGMQDLVVQVTDVNGCVGTAKKSIEGLVPPHPDFAADLRFACAPVSIQFTDFSTGGNGIATWSWDFGNGISSQDSQPLIPYLQDGVFDVMLKVTGENGCSDSIRHQAYIRLQHPEANFTVAAGDRCPDDKILFENLSSSDTSLTNFQWTLGDGNSSDLEAPIHQYSTPGTYLPSLWVEDAKGCRDTFTTTEPILIVEDVEPEQIQVKSVSVRSPHTVELTFEPFDNVRGDFGRYIIYRKNTQDNFEPIASLMEPGIGIFTDTLDQGVDTGAPHCYRIIVENLCGTRAPLAPSEIHCTIDLSTQAATERVEVSWTPYVGWSRVEQYLLYRTILGSSSDGELIATLPGDLTTYTDTDMYCYDQYEYKVTALGGRGLSSQSDTAQAIPDHLAPTIPHHMERVSVENDDFLLVEWDELILAQGASVLVERDAGNGYQSIFMQPYDQSNFKYQDVEVDVQEKSYAYRVFSIDSCGDITPAGRIGKSILLEVQTNGRINTLIWTPYEGWPQGVAAYRIEIYDEARNQYQVLARLLGDQTQYTDQAFERRQIQNCYRIVAEAQHRENYESTSNEVCNLQKPKLTAPNAFTPNGDGQNDVFTLEGLFLGEVEMQIFNRWGILVYRTESLDLSWDGYARSGGPSPEGVYTFVVTGRGMDGTRLKRTGTVHLIR